MGPALVVRSHDQVSPGAGSKVIMSSGYASLAGKPDAELIHQNHRPAAPAAAAVGCPHAQAAAHTAATTLADGKSNPASTPIGAAASVCPVSGASAQTPTPASTQEPTAAEAHPGSFSYDNFWNNQLDKKHEDKSYRYFNNINRLAAKYPVAHTARTTDEVAVWCSNDYLGMGRNPVVLETMQ